MNYAKFTYFLTYLYLFGNKCAKYELSKILVFLMPPTVRSRSPYYAPVWSRRTAYGDQPYK